MTCSHLLELRGLSVNVELDAIAASRWEMLLWRNSTAVSARFGCTVAP